MQSGPERVIEPRESVQRLSHRATRVEGEDDLMAALDAIFPSEESHVPGGGLPIDAPPAHAGLPLPQRVEFRTLAHVPLELEAFPQILAIGESQGLPARRSEIRDHLQFGGSLAPVFAGQ